MRGGERREREKCRKTKDDTHEDLLRCGAERRMCGPRTGAARPVLLSLVHPPVLEHLDRLGVLAPADGELHQIAARRHCVGTAAAASAAGTAAARIGTRACCG